MRAMILAAGLGKRMGELTASTPKPLLKLHGTYLIEYSLANLKRAGVTDVVINLHYFSDQIKQALGNGGRYGMHIEYSDEAERLETGGGIVKALPLLGDKPFMVISSDIVSDYPLTQLPKVPTGLGHLVMVPNPDFKPQGDFGLVDGFLNRHIEERYTYGNIGIFKPEFFAGCKVEVFPLNRLLMPGCDQKQLTGEIYQGVWFNIGSPKELQLAKDCYALKELLAAL